MVKLSLCLISKALCHVDVKGSGGIVQPIVMSALVGDECSASRSFRSIPGEGAHRYPSERRRGGSEDRCG
jgi:hypothetical protein